MATIFSRPQCINKLIMLMFHGIPKSQNRKTSALQVQWNLSVTTTSMMKFITCDLFSNVF